MADLRPPRRRARCGGGAGTGARTRAAASAPMPTLDGDAARRGAGRRPARRPGGRDRSSATTTRATPAVDQRLGARRRAAVVDARLERGVRGGAAGAVAGGRAGPRPRRAAPPGGSVAPSPTTSPSRTTTQPTHGLGAVRRRAVSPRASARRISSASSRPPLLLRLPWSRLASTREARTSRGTPTADGACGARSVVVCALSHPDSHRRPRLLTGSATRWLPWARGLPGCNATHYNERRTTWPPPVGTCTQPRGHCVSL